MGRKAIVKTQDWGDGETQPHRKAASYEVAFSAPLKLMTSYQSTDNRSVGHGKASDEESWGIQKIKVT